MKELKDALEALLGDNIEVVEVPRGSTIEREMAKRGYHHEEDSSQASDEEPPMEREAQRQQALRMVRGRQADLLQALDIYKDLEKSIATPDNERKLNDHLNELVMILKLKAMGL